MEDTTPLIWERFFKDIEGKPRSIHLRNKNEGHGEEAAEDDSEGDEGEGGVLLGGDNEGDRSRDEAQDHHVVDAHANLMVKVML